MNSLFIFCLQASIITCGLSISLGQFFLFFSFVFYLFQKENKIHHSKFLYLSLGIFGLYFISSLYHFAFFDKVIFSKSSELKDIFLLLAFVITQGLNLEDRQKIKNAFLALIILVIFTGLISIFSPVRISKYITELFFQSKNYKFSHSYGDIFGINLHIPIGFLNTHLTFGGILMLCFPSLFFLIFQTKNKLMYSLLCLLMLIIFVLNNARSAFIASIISISIGIIIYFIQYKKFTKKIFYISILILFTFSTFGFYSITKTTIGAKIIKPLLGEEKHTDFGRNFIWHSSFELIKKNVFLGIGPGNYNSEVEKIRKDISEKKSELLFFNEVTQKGHAHNDYFHLWVISGIFAPMLYLSILACIMYILLDKNFPFKEKSMYFSLIGFFIAGVFQCYFQDDEVVILFWYLVGLLHSEYNSYVQNSEKFLESSKLNKTV